MSLRRERPHELTYLPHSHPKPSFLCLQEGSLWISFLPQQRWEAGRVSYLVGHLSRLERNTSLPYQVLCQVRTYELQMSQQMETIFNTDKCWYCEYVSVWGPPTSEAQKTIWMSLKFFHIDISLLNFSRLILKWTFQCLGSAPFAVAQQLMLGKKKERERERGYWVLEMGDGVASENFPGEEDLLLKIHPFFFPSLSHSIISLLLSLPLFPHFSVQPISLFPPLLDSYLTFPP